VLQVVAVCCSVLQCVAVCCSVLQCVAAFEGCHYEESRFYLVLFGKETVKTFFTNVLVRIKCSFVIENLFRRDYLD